MADTKKRIGHKTKTSFKPGNNANPFGRPVAELTLSSIIRRKLADQYTSEEYLEAVSKVEHIANKILDTIMTTKDPRVLKEYSEFIADRTEGRPQNKVDVTSNGQTITPILGGIVNQPDDK